MRSKKYEGLLWYYEPDEKKLLKCGVVTVDENGRILNMTEKSPTPATHWCTPPFYYYTREDARRVPDGIAAGCGVTRTLQCDNLKTGVITHGQSEITLNKSYNDLAEHYGTAILPCRVRSPRDKAMVEGTVGVVSNFILAVFIVRILNPCGFRARLARDDALLESEYSSREFRFRELLPLA